MVFGVLRKSATTVESQKEKHMNKRKMILNRDVYEDTITIEGTTTNFVTVETYVSKKDHIGKWQKTFLTDTNSTVNPYEA